MKKATAAGIVILAVLLVFGQAALFGFVGLDDTNHILENPHFASPLSWRALFEFWRAPYFGLYIPLVYSVWGVLVGAMQALGGAISPAPFHVLNIACHMLNSLLVLRLLQLVGCRVPAALLGALFFALHPLQVEAVVWVSGFKDLFCAFWVLAAACLWLSQPVDPRDQQTGYGIRAAAACCFLLALLAKPGAVVAPFLIMAWVAARARCLRVTRQGAMIAVFAALLAAVVALQTSELQQAAQATKGAPLWARPLLAADALGFWLGKLCWPWPLCFDYGRTPGAALTDPWLWLKTALPVALIFGALMLLRRRRLAVPAAALALFLLGCAGNLGIIAFGFQNISTVADRYVYLSLSGAALAVAWAAESLPRRAAIVAGLLLVLAAGVASVFQGVRWRSAEELFRYTLERNPASFTAAGGLAYALHVRGDIAAALPLYERAIALQPRFADGHTNLATALLQQGHAQAAIDHFEQALAIMPDDGVTLNNLGLALQRTGRRDAARKSYEAAMRITHSPLAAHNLGSLLEEMNEPSGALAAFQYAVAVAPGMSDSWQRLGGLYARAGDDSRAEEAYRHVVKLDPARGEAWSALGALLIRQGRRGEADACFTRARAPLP